MVRALLAALLVAATVSGCAANRPKTPLERLQIATTGYYDGLRWKSYSQSAGYLMPADRAKFLDKHESQRDELSILDYAVRRLQISTEEEKAVVEVEYTWTRIPSTVVRTTRVLQNWEQLEDAWFIVDQRTVDKNKRDDKKDQEDKEPEATAPAAD